MLKGCTKKVIFVKLTDNYIYEEAYFVVRPGITTVCAEGDLLTEAKKIISGGCVEKTLPKNVGKIKTKLKISAYFLCGAVFSAAITLILKLAGAF